MTTKSDLAPVKRELVIDLAAKAGIDASDWGDFKGGKEKASVNPKYCYEWAFVEPGKVVVINLWHKALIEDGDLIYQKINMRQRSAQPVNSSSEAVWKRRAEKFDKALQFALSERLPIRAVLCDGKMRDPNDPHAKASSVTKRMLDPAPWAITSYDQTTGEFIVTRGEEPSRFVDQFMVIKPDASPPEKRSQTVQAFARDSRVRKRALERANGKCEWCNVEGFQMANGGIYLETHHIIPLAEGGLNKDTNVTALCPNHHREAHYGKGRERMREELLKSIAAFVQK